MSALTCADVRELASEFAFGVLDGDERADVVQHIDRCPRCRTFVADLSETADALVLLAPKAEPPPGFERRVLAQLTGGTRRRRWRTVKLVAGVAAAAIIVSIVTVRVIDATRREPTAPAAVETVPMVGADGTTVGHVDVVDAGVTTNLALTVEYALSDGPYRVVLAPPAAPREVLGTMTVAGGRGEWLGSAAVRERPVDLELVDDAGDVPCSARLATS
jgi:anti-sigma factor RsiW